jgi:RHS repeat-associated protein
MRRWTAALAAAVLLGAGLSAPAATAKPAPYRPTPVQKIPPVPTRDVATVKADRSDPAATAAARQPAAPTWPVPGAHEIDLGTPTAPLARVPGTAFSVRGTGRSPRRARITILSRSAATGAGLHGVLARVDAVGTARAGETVEVAVDYGPFAGAYGGDWSNRLRLVAVPECALIRSGSPACAPVPLRTRNDMVARTLTATAPVGTLLATEADPAGGAGDYTATKLQPSSTWSGGAGSGDFTWNYPMRVPPSVGGPAPVLNLAYSAQSVDGMTAASNNQPGWAGAGFEFTPGGFIERRYKPCADDMGGGNNSGTRTGDLCWATDNAVLSLSGHSGELLYNSAEDQWHLRRDDGTRVRRLTGAVNGDDNGEYWIVTTSDGTQYWFGRNRLPGWSGGQPETGSVVTAPVFGNHPNEPCNAATFASSSCAQAWRWSLDYVIDMNGNSMSFWYATDSNRYARNMDTANPVAYQRDAWLTRVAYGTKSSKDLVADPSQATAVDSIFTTPAPAEVAFGVADRCDSGCTTHDALHWKDVPWDQECTGSSCYVGSPTFWSTKRLSTVTTRVRSGSGYRDVETWTLTHTYPDPGDGTRAALWLSKLSHRGGTTTVPDIEFAGVQKNNRVDPDGTDRFPAMNWWRIWKIKTETGGVIAVTYSDVDCTDPGRLPDVNALENNAYRCYPVRWTRPGESTPTLEFFHKYVVTAVRESDNTGGTPPFGSPEVEHTYTYPANGAAWAYTDDDGIIKAENKTWSVWRGYATVGVTTGKPGDTPTFTESTFFRGLHGDHLPSGTRSVVLPAVDLNGDGDVTDPADAAAVNDEAAFAGQLRRTVTYLGPGGAEESSTVNQPWQSAPTATRTINSVTVDARRVGVADTHRRVRLDHTPGWRTTSTHTEFDAYGLPVRSDDFADDTRTDDDQCTVTSYARNTPAWLLNRPREVTVFARTCSGAADPSQLTEADVISNVRTSYDGRAYGADPTKGMATQVATAVAWTAGNPTDQAIVKTVYDAQGRVKETVDALNRKTTTAYTPAAGGPLTQTVVTAPSPFFFTTTTVLDPGFGVETSTTDTNGGQTVLHYDGLARLTDVWLPGRDAASTTPNLRYAYDLRDTAPTVVTTSKLNPVGGYLTSYTLLDGLLRERQTQTRSPSAGRILTDTFYDTAGRKLRTYGSYYDNRGGPGSALVVPLTTHSVAEQRYFRYDGAGRTTDDVFDPNNNGERWRTHTDFFGDRTDVTPPAGGTRTSTFMDARGNRTALWQYGYPTANDHVTTTYRVNRKNQLDQIVDDAGNHWDYTYYLSGLTRTLRDPDSGTTTTTYDKAGQLTSTKNEARNQTLVYDYDTLGRKRGLYLTSISPANKLATWEYDSAYIEGTTTPAKGHPSASTRWTDAGTTPYTTTVTGYTPGYRATGTRYTIPAGETGLGGTYEFQQTYRPDGSPESTAFPAVGDLPVEGVTIGYEPVLGLADNLTTVLDVSELSYVSATAYDELGRVGRYELYTGMMSGTGSRAWLTYQRDLQTTRLTDVRTERQSLAPNIVTDLTYSFSDAGDITRITDAATNDTQCLEYDGLRRLVQAWTPATTTCGTPSPAGLGGPAKYWVSWSVNAVGNRTQQVEHPTAAGDPTRTTDYAYPAAGADRPHAVQATTGAATGTYRYDGAGNTVCRRYADGNACPATPGPADQTLTWDAEGHQASSRDATGLTEYVYDADGNRLLRRDPTGRTLYLPGQEVRYTNATGTSTGTRYYTFNGVTVASRTGSGLSWLADDHQGTANVAINAVSQVATIRRQTPFGGARGSTASWPNSQGFVGGVNDNTGLVHLGAREYDTSLGKFVSVDPFLDKDDPQSLSNYGYADHSPATLTDPGGTYIPCGTSDDPLEQGKDANDCVDSANEAARKTAEEGTLQSDKMRRAEEKAARSKAARAMNRFRHTRDIKWLAKWGRTGWAKNFGRVLIGIGFVLNAVGYFADGDGPITALSKAAVVSTMAYMGEEVGSGVGFWLSGFCGEAIPVCTPVFTLVGAGAGSWVGSWLGEKAVDGILEKLGVWDLTEKADDWLTKKIDSFSAPPVPEPVKPVISQAINGLAQVGRVITAPVAPIAGWFRR